MSRIALQPAFVLHRRPYQDSSQLLELLTHEHGRIGAVARGVRRAKSKWAGVLQPFSPLLVSWSGRGDLVTLTGVEPQGVVPALPPARLLSASYASELVIRLLQRHDPHPQLYERYAAAMVGLKDTTSSEAALLRVFEKCLLSEIGYALNLTHDARTGEPIEAGTRYVYHLEQGPEAAEDTHGPMCFQGSSLLALAQEQLGDVQVLRDARRLLRPALDLYLGGRPLKSRQVLQATRASRAPPP